MGIKVEFNPDLALRNISHYKSGQRRLEECILEDLTVGTVYAFLKEGQRNYWLDGEIPLLQTEGNGVLSRPLASIIILEYSHFRKDGVNYTKGLYQVKAIFDINDPKIHFNGFNRV
jgi:hypothetical protein